MAVTTVISTKGRTQGSRLYFLFPSRTRSLRRSVRAISGGIMTGIGIERRMRGNPAQTWQTRRLP
jgi:hypothetical protein